MNHLASFVLLGIEASPVYLWMARAESRVIAVQAVVTLTARLKRKACDHGIGHGAHRLLMPEGIQQLVGQAQGLILGIAGGRDIRFSPDQVAIEDLLLALGPLTRFQGKKGNDAIENMNGEAQHLETEPEAGENPQPRR